MLSTKKIIFITPEILIKVSEANFNVAPASQFYFSTLKDDPIWGHIARALSAYNHCF